MLNHGKDHRLAAGRLEEAMQCLIQIVTDFLGDLQENSLIML